MTEDDALNAIYLRADPVPPHIAPGATRVSLCVDIRDEDIVARAPSNGCWHTSIS